MEIIKQQDSYELNKYRYLVIPYLAWKIANRTNLLNIDATMRPIKIPNLPKQLKI